MKKSKKVSNFNDYANKILDLQHGVLKQFK